MTPGIVAHRDAVMHAFGRRTIAHQPPDRRREVAIGILGVDAAFDRPAGELDVALAERQRLAVSNADHLLDEVDAGDEFGHRMLDLKPGIHLKEVEAPVLPGDELDRSGAVVAHGLGQGDGLLAHLGPRGLIEQRARRFLDDLLVAALDRAFALAKIDDVAVLIAQDLDFDVARIGDELLDEHAVVAEARFRLRARTGKAFRQLAAAVGDAHALAAAAGRRLDHDRIADLVGNLFGLLVVFDHTEMAGHGCDLGGRRGPFALDLIAHGADRLGIGPNKHDAGLGERLCERLALGEKAVARVHSLGAGRLAGIDDLVDEEIALRGGRRSDQDGFIGHFHMQCVAVGLGINRNGGDAHSTGGFDNPAGDFAAIGNQDSLEHSG